MPTGTTPDDWLTTTQAAQYLGYRSSETVRRLIADGELAARRRGTRNLIHRAELDRWLAPDPDCELVQDGAA